MMIRLASPMKWITTYADGSRWCEDAKREAVDGSAMAKIVDQTFAWYTLINKDNDGFCIENHVTGGCLWVTPNHISAIRTVAKP